jgi:LysM repeat protein
MKIKSIFLAALVCVSIAVRAQSPLQVQGITPNLYLVHTVVAKDNWYSIGRLYNIGPKELAPFNDLPMDKPLAIGQQIRIPLTASNFSQDNEKAADEVFVPVYYVVKEREWMYRISQNNNKVPIERLGQWNNLTNGDIKPGMQVIVGYLKVKSSQSPLASQSASIRTTPPVAKTSDAVQRNTETAAATKTEMKPLETSHTESAKTENKVEEKPVETTENRTLAKPEVKSPETKPETRPAETKPVETKTVETKPIFTQTPVDNKGGFFKPQYGETGRATTGAAGVFRSTSGWQDGKYYALMNNVPVGTIIKVANPSNGKTVYAKVLGTLPDMKESNGLTLRLSDAAATELGLAANKFPVSVHY